MAKNASKKERLFSARNVENAAKLTYRQLNDWEAKGIIQLRRTEKSSWRKFNGRQLFALMVCSEIRTRFGVSKEALRWVYSTLSRRKRTVLWANIERAEELSVPFFLLTDLKKVMMIDMPKNIIRYLEEQFFTQEEDEGIIMFKVNSLVQRFFKEVKDKSEE